MITVDASVLIAHFKPLDAHHAAAIEFFEGTLSEELVIHPLTLAEVLVSAVKIGSAADMLTDIESLGLRSSVHEPGESLRLATLRVSTGLKMPDCCVLDCALMNDAALATFDDPLGRAAERLQVSIAN